MMLCQENMLPDAYYNSSISNAFEKNPKINGNCFLNITNTNFHQKLVKHNALLNYYPPGGFIGWHTNWNLPIKCYLRIVLMVMGILIT